MILSPHNKIHLARHGVRRWLRKPLSTQARQAIRRAERKRERQDTDQLIQHALMTWDLNYQRRTVQQLLTHIDQSSDPFIDHIQLLLRRGD